MRQADITFSVIFDRKDKFEIGLSFLKISGFREGFSIDGRTSACLKSINHTVTIGLLYQILISKPIATEEGGTQQL